MPPMTRCASYGVLLRIHFQGVRYTKMKCLVLSLQVLRDEALAHLRLLSGFQEPQLPAYLDASVDSVSIQGEQIDLREYSGQNLGTMIQRRHGLGTVPEFRITVRVGNLPPPPPTTRPVPLVATDRSGRRVAANQVHPNAD